MMFGLFPFKRDGSAGSWSVSDDEVENTGRKTSFLHEGTHANSRERGESEGWEKDIWFDNDGR
jgi:hypothetical protein